MVAMNVWPTDGAAGSVATEARWRSMGRVWAPSGIVAGISGELAPSLAFPNLTVQSGAAWVDGHYTELTSNQVITATANGLAVIRFDPAANTAELLWRDAISVPAQSPTGVWELPIAKTVGSVLTDLRALASLGYGMVPGGYKSLAATQSSITGITDLTGLSVAFTAFPAHKYRAVFEGQALNSVASMNTFYITSALNTVLGEKSHFLASNGAASQFVRVSAILTGFSGLITIKVRAANAPGGLGGLQVSVNATVKAEFTVEDLGPG